MACQAMLAGMKFSITGTQNSHGIRWLCNASVPIDVLCMYVKATTGGIQCSSAPFRASLFHCHKNLCWTITNQWSYIVMVPLLWWNKIYKHGKYELHGPPVVALRVIPSMLLRSWGRRMEHMFIFRPPSLHSITLSDFKKFPFHIFLGDPSPLMFYFCHGPLPTYLYFLFPFQPPPHMEAIQWLQRILSLKRNRQDDC